MAAKLTVQPYHISNGGSLEDRSSSGKIEFSTALSVWKDINLSELQATLVEVAPALVEAQKASLVSRKKLAEHTRDFKKQPDESKLEGFKPLLKAYQIEIDGLTKRSKTAENAFLNVHAALRSAPDPYPFLEVVLEQAASLNDLDAVKQENARLQQENAQFKSNQSQTQVDQEEKIQLHERIKQLESGFEQRVQQRCAELEKEVSAKWDERIRNLNEREKDLTKSVNLAQEQLRELKSKDETTTAKLLEKGQEEEERETRGKLIEIQLLTRDLERAQTRIESVEKRNEQLRAEIESVKSGRAENERMEKLEKESIEKESKISHLQALVDRERERADNADQQVQATAQEKAKLQKDKSTEIETLKAKLSKLSDYDEIKRELEIVKMVEFSNDDEETASEQLLGATESKPLEALLLEKNKRLQDQLTSLRVAHEELSSTSQTSDSEINRLKKDVARLKSLNEKLENDLVSVGANGLTTNPVPTMSAEEALEEMDRIEAEATTGGTRSSKVKSKTEAKTASNAEASGSNAPLTATLASPHPPTMGGQGSASTSDTSILPIITSQRDRFRTRNTELEEELRKQFETISELRVEVKTLQSDNLSLYEKVRYLQTYGPSGRNRGTGVDAVIHFGNNASLSAVGKLDPSGAYPPPQALRERGGEEKYRAKYEESMNPFEAFRGREQNRALSQLNPLERVLHMLAKMVLSDRRMRLLFMVYAIFLHFMMFGMLFEMGHSSSTLSCTIPDDLLNLSHNNVSS